MTADNPADLIQEAESILNFLCEVLSGISAPGRVDSGLTGTGTDGLAIICIYLRELCRKAAQAEDGFRLSPE